jgi:hypothetical protein
VTPHRSNCLRMVFEHRTAEFSGRRHWSASLPMLLRGSIDRE